MIAQHKASQNLTNSDEEGTPNILSFQRESNQFTDQTQRTNDSLLYKVMGDVEDFPCHERQFLSQLQEQDRIALHTADKQYNKDDAKNWVSEIGENKIEEIQNALLMAWEKFDHIPQKSRSKK